MKLAVLDLETDPFKEGRKPEPFLSGYYDGAKYTTIWENDPIALIDRTITMLEREPASLIYWHNGGKFDVFYFLPHVKGALKILSNRIVSCTIGKHEFRDSYAIMPFPLAAYRKDEIDYSIMERGARERHKAEIIEYLRGDCVYLYELVTTFHSEFGNRLTIGGSSMRQLKAFHSFDSGDAMYDSSLRKNFYHGGRNECFEGGVIYAPIKVYDVNSMYPYVMHDFPHPVSTGIVEDSRVDDSTAFVTVSGRNHGAFAVRTKTGLDFTAKQGTFHTTIHEYRAALDTGTFEGVVVKAYSFTEFSSFDSFVDHFFDERKAAKLSGPTKHAVTASTSSRSTAPMVSSHKTPRISSTMRSPQAISV